MRILTPPPIPKRRNLGTSRAHQLRIDIINLQLLLMTESQLTKIRWSTHYQWVIMLIVLVIGFGLIGALGVWFKRRYDAKRPNLYHGGSSGTLSTGSPPGPRDAAWGPTPMPAQSARSLPSGSGTSSQTNIAKSSTPVPGSRTRLTKIDQRPENVETRQV
jgi:hypothetical protein